MTETCKICGRDTTTDRTYKEVSEPEKERYIVCNNCYPLNCPKCGKEMEPFDPGCDFEADCKGEYLSCKECDVHFSTTIWVRKWWFWWQQYCRDVGMAGEIHRRNRAEFMERYKKWKKTGKWE